MVDNKHAPVDEDIGVYTGRRMYEKEGANKGIYGRRRPYGVAGVTAAVVMQA